MNIKIHGLDELKKTLDATPKHITLALARAMKDTAAMAKSAVRQEMSQKFDRPTPWALDAVRVASKEKLAVTIGFTANRSENPGSWTQPEFVSPQVHGGSRAIKRFERILRNAGVLPAGMSVAPAKGAWLDQYGNIPGQEIEQILRSVKGYGERSQIMTRKGKLRTAKQNRYFVMKRGGRPIGIFERIWGGGIRASMVFISKPHYSSRISFYSIVIQTFRAHLNRNFQNRFKEYSKYSL